MASPVGYHLIEVDFNPDKIHYRVYLTSTYSHLLKIGNMNSGITGLSQAGYGKLSAIPPEGIDFDVTYDIALEFERGLDWSNLPLAKEVRATISVKPFFDENYLPDGAYQLRTEKATWQMHRPRERGSCQRTACATF